MCLQSVPEFVRLAADGDSGRSHPRPAQGPLRGPLQADGKGGRFQTEDNMRGKDNFVVQVLRTESLFLAQREVLRDHADQSPLHGATAWARKPTELTTFSGAPILLAGVPWPDQVSS